MEKYFVVEAYRYKSSGKWENKIAGSYDTFPEAKNSFHARKAAITKDSNDFAMCTILDAYGNSHMPDFDDSTVPEPEPTPEPTPEPNEG